MLKNKNLKEVAQYSPGYASPGAVFGREEGGEVIESALNRIDLTKKQKKSIAMEGRKIHKNLKRDFNKEFNDNPTAKTNRILIHKSAGVETIGHEVGHAQSFDSRAKKLKTTVDSLNGTSGNITIHSPKLIDHSGKTKVSFKDAFHDLTNNISQGRKNLKEEKEASKRGINMIKKYGGTKEQVKQAKENLGHAYDTYKHTNRASIKTSLANLIDIPSRRNVGQIV